MNTLRKIQSGSQGSKHKSHMRVVKGISFKQEKKIIRAGQFWIFCQGSLFSNQVFDEKQKQEFIRLIQEHFKTSKDADKTFTDLIQRACLAKRYVARRGYRYISKPIDWLNINYKNGLSGTASWLKNVEKQRKSVPHYNEGIKIFSKALLSYFDYCKLSDILKSRNTLIELKQTDLLQMYINTIMHTNYFN